MLAAYDTPASSYQILAAAKNVAIFNAPRMADIIKNVHLACSYLANDPKTSNDLTRTLMVNNQFVIDTYRFHCALLASGYEATEVYRSSNAQKFFMRQLKAADSVVQEKTIKGAASVQRTFKADDNSALLLAIYGSIFLSSKSYNSSMAYLLRAYKIAPKEPLVLLLLGIANIHRALQRQTLNRHAQILQGFSYLLEYRDVRAEEARIISRMQDDSESSTGAGADTDMPDAFDDILTKTLWEEQEVYYNLGRAFHTLGLFSLATHHYHKVLDEYPASDGYEYDLRMHAAYNLQSIYNACGNLKLSRHIVDVYLTI